MNMLSEYKILVTMVDYRKLTIQCNVSVTVV